MENLNMRISKVIEYSNLSAAEFAESVGVPRSSISHIASGRNKPSLDFLIKVKDRFPELQWDWIIKGDGEMLRSKDTKEVTITQKMPQRPPDLFTLIEDDNFGKTVAPENTIAPKQLESSVDDLNHGQNAVSNSQVFTVSPQSLPEPRNTAPNAVKRIVMFFENGKFESFEP